MLRSIWVAFFLVFHTIFFATIVIGAAALRVRGGVYMWVTRNWSRGFLWASGVRVRAEGLEHVAAGTPRIVVSNHLSWYDIIAIASVLPGTFLFIGKKELNRIPFFGLAWRAAGHISIDRSDRERAYQGLRRAGERVRAEGAAVVIFPEGTRSRDGRLQPFKRGAFSLAVETGVPVVPTVVQGSYEIMPPGSYAIHARPVRVRFFPPMPVERGASTEAVSRRVRGLMLEALGEHELPPGAVPEPPPAAPPAPGG